jgi:hypothetical protein
MNKYSMQSQVLIRRALSRIGVGRAPLLTLPIESKQISQAPHSIDMYGDWLSQLLDAGIHLTAIPSSIQNAYSLSLRHDIDSVPENILLFLDIEKKYGVSGAYYFLVKNATKDIDVSYKLTDQRKIAESIKAAGGIVGLHSVAWSKSNGIEVFKQECKLFYDAFGYEPHYWTHHGFFSNNDPRSVYILRLLFELKFMKVYKRQFTQARYVLLSDSNGRVLPKQFPIGLLKPNFPNEIMTHTDYWK